MIFRFTGHNFKNPASKKSSGWYLNGHGSTFLVIAKIITL